MDTNEKYLNFETESIYELVIKALYSAAYEALGQEQKATRYIQLTRNEEMEAITAIKQLYDHSYLRIKLENTLFDAFLVTKEFRQGCCCCALFKIYLNEALKIWRKACSEMGVQLNDETTLFTLHFADDQVVIVQDKEDLELMTRTLFENNEIWRVNSKL